MPVDWRDRLRELEDRADAFDRAVERSQGIDPFCSRCDWLLPYYSSQAQPSRLRWGQSGNNFIAWTLSPHHDLGVLAQALETAWMFACPVVGPQHLDLLQEALLGEGLNEVNAFVLSGRQLAPSYQQALQHLHTRFAVHSLRPTRRVLASLQGGIDAYWSRRSANLRRSLRRSAQRARGAGVELERLVLRPGDNIDALYQRVLNVERRSWKSRQGVGVDQGSMRVFYHHMLHRLARRAGALLIFARRADCDLGYMHAGLAGERARGFQFSFDHREARLGLGNLLHAELITWLCKLGVQTYDLGMWVAYKERWGEQRMITPNFLLLRR